MKRYDILIDNDGYVHSCIVEEEYGDYIKYEDYILDKQKDFKGIGKWLSASLDDPKVCDVMKKDIEEWFKRKAKI